MSSTTLFYILTTLALSPLVSARGRGGGGGGSSSSSSSSTVTGGCGDSSIQIATLCIAKIWIIIPSVILGLILLAVIFCVLKKCGCCGWFSNRTSRVKTTYNADGGIGQAAAVRHEAWGNTWQQNYAQIPSHQGSQNTLPYAQGGLGYAHTKEQTVYSPPNHDGTYPNSPYHHHQHTGSQSFSHKPTNSQTHLQQQHY
ncbi:hypothetical protein M408DRAFT_9268 [Serendipita vermifera MAFF 305830]|uniref:Uncharacterized protein n=1 Tax=Serendipita vermifera MAFF 305830 TaxID=933852 RepID=A0A0C3B809_SERVB|nr:hypothetical protein M408DRAFT_9268 [Serendipita vermifera MAFF 305830]